MVETSTRPSTDTTEMHSLVTNTIVCRLVSNLTSSIALDVDKQMAINVFLGVYQPEEGEINVWDLPTDYYLHHTQARVLPGTSHTASYTKWWDSELLSILPLPLYRSETDPESCNAASSSAREEKTNLDSFNEVYKPLELSDFDALFARNITRTAE